MSELSGVRAPGSWLRRQREAAGLTQEELAERSGLSVRAISNLERDRTRRPHPDTLRRVAGSLGLTGAELTDLTIRYRAVLGLPAPAPEEGGLLAASGGERGGLGRVTAVVPRQLPAAVASFAGRAAELAVLDQWLDDATRNPGPAVVISAVGGMAGVGKTALALYWAHRVADRFPDGQLYANLRGHDPGGKPADAAELVRGFLHALGIAPEWIPPTAEGQTALYRSVLAGRRMLIVADNARNAAQVRPLLPGTPGSVVLVTSRSQLSGLVAAEGARMLSLDVLTPADAAGLLAARLGPDRVTAEPDAVAELIRLCGRLPMALAIVAARAGLSGWPLAALVKQLADAEDRLEELGLDDPAADVRAVFSWSCRQLSDESARMFRLLAVHPGPDISAAAAASLAGVPVARALALLHELAAASLAVERVPGRYALHDLLRAYAAGPGGPDTTGAEGRAAASAMLDHYLHTAVDAARVLDPAQPAAPGPPGHDVIKEQISRSDQALAWFEAERHVLLAVIAQAAKAGSYDHARQMAGALEPFFFRRSNWPELAVTQQIALDCSDRLGDPAGRARGHLHLGRALAGMGQPGPAREHLSRAVEMSSALGDRSTQARAHLAFSHVWPAGECDPAEGIARCLQALHLAEADSDLALMAHACNNLGYDYALQGDTERALAYCRRALDLCRRADVDPALEGHAEDSLGYVYGLLGDQRQAIASYSRAVRTFRAIGAPCLGGQSLSHLGDCQAAAGNAEAAIDAWEQALAILGELNHPDASQIRHKLGELREVTRKGSPSNAPKS